MPNFEIPFTQYLRPDGRTREVFAPCDSETYEKSQKILARGVRFTTEVLTTSEVALYAEQDGEDIVTEFSKNGPELEEKMIIFINAVFERVVS